MNTMRINNSIVRLDAIYDISCVKYKEGTVVRVEYPRSIKEYLVPGFFKPEVVAAAIHQGMNDEGNSFDLMAKLQALDRIYGGVRVDETKNES